MYVIAKVVNIGDKIMAEIYCDGSVIDWYGSAYYVICFDSRKKHETFKKLTIVEGKFCPIEIEYMAMLEALKRCKKHYTFYFVYTDNLQIYLELNGLNNVKEITKKYYDNCLQQIKNSRRLNNTIIAIKKIDRKDNLAGIYLEKRLNKLKRPFKK